MDKQSVMDPKKRAIDALERRFAFSKAKMEDGCKIQRKRARKEAVKWEKGERGGDSKDASSEGTLSSSKKGATARGSEYLELPHTFHENLLNPGDKPSDNGSSTVHTIVHDLLCNGDAAHKYMQGSRNIKINNWFLLDNFVPNDFSSASARVKSLRNLSKRSKRHMSMKQHKKIGSFALSLDSLKYEGFVPLHEMWNDYIVKLIQKTGKNQMPQRLLAADLHGAFLLVAQCKQTPLVGINGIMIRETAETFGIISEDNKFQVIPKKGSVFIFGAGSLKVTLIGDKLSGRDSGI